MIVLPWRIVDRAVYFYFVVLIILIGFVINLYQVHSLEMHESTPGWYVDAIPPALSAMYFGHPADYTGLADIRDRFQSKVLGYDRSTLNDAIANTLATDPSTISSEKYLMGADDKGVVDFVKLSFLIFGNDVEGFLYTYFLILAVSSAVFIIHFWRKFWALLLLIVFYAAHYVVVPTVTLNLQLKSVIAMRFIPVVTMIACLHVLIALGQARLTTKDVLPVLVQTLLIMFVLHIRSSAVWQMIAAGLAVPFVVLYRVSWIPTRRQPEPRRTGERQLFRRVFLIAWPLVVLVLAFFSLQVYKKVVYAPTYHAGEQIASRVFWHVLFSGLAFHPELASQLHIKIDDVSVIRATGEFLLAGGRAEEWEAIGGASPNFRDIRWMPYDKVVGEMFVRTCTTQLLRCVAAATYYKPIALMKNLAWLSGITPNPPNTELLDEAVQRQLSEMTRLMKSRNQYANVFRYEPLLLIVCFSVLFSVYILPYVGVTSCYFAPLFCGSLIPALIVYPVPHTVGEPAVAFAMLFYLALGLLCARLAVIVKAWLVRQLPG